MKHGKNQKFPFFSQYKITLTLSKKNFFIGIFPGFCLSMVKNGVSVYLGLMK